VSWRAEKLLHSLLEGRLRPAGSFGLDHEVRNSAGGVGVDDQVGVVAGDPARNAYLDLDGIGRILPRDDEPAEHRRADSFLRIGKDMIGGFGAVIPDALAGEGEIPATLGFGYQLRPLLRVSGGSREIGGVGGRRLHPESSRPETGGSRWTWAASFARSDAHQRDCSLADW